MHSLQLQVDPLIPDCVLIRGRRLNSARGISREDVHVRAVSANGKKGSSRSRQETNVVIVPGSRGALPFTPEVNAHDEEYTSAICTRSFAECSCNAEAPPRSASKVRAGLYTPGHGRVPGWRARGAKANNYTAC